MKMIMDAEGEFLLGLGIGLLFCLIVGLVQDSQINSLNNELYCGSKSVKYDKVVNQSSGETLGFRCCTTMKNEYLNESTGEIVKEKNKSCTFRRGREVVVQKECPKCYNTSNLSSNWIYVGGKENE